MPGPSFDDAPRRTDGVWLGQQSRPSLQRDHGVEFRESVLEVLTRHLHRAPCSGAAPAMAFELTRATGAAATSSSHGNLYV